MAGRPVLILGEIYDPTVHPSHPIAPGGPPLGIWGGGGVGNYPDAGFPGQQPGGPVRPWGPINYPDQGLPGQQPRPSHPIYIPGYPPLQIWGGGGVGNYPDAGFPGPQPGQPPRPWGPINYPDQSLPGNQPYPDQSLPPGPSHPIVIPWPPGEQPPTDGNGLHPTHPIVIPPPQEGSGEGETKKVLLYVYIPAPVDQGCWFLMEVPVTPPPTEAQPKG
jgi:hypothetical protein